MATDTYTIKRDVTFGLCFGRGGLSFSTGEIRGIWAWRGLVQALVASGANPVQTVVLTGF